MPLLQKALSAGDVKLTDKVLSLDGEINHMERTIETLCLKLLVTATAGGKGFAANFRSP